MARVQIISHTEHTTALGYDQVGMGEIPNSRKLRDFLLAQGYDVPLVWDVYERFGSREAVERFAKLNHELCAAGHSLCEDLPIGEEVFPAEGIALVLTYEWLQGCVLGSGLRKRVPTIAKCYAPHRGKALLAALYAGCDMIVTECLRANVMGVAAGVPAWKMVYLPHCVPKKSVKGASKRKTLEKIAARMGKSVAVDEETVVVGLVSRFKQGKNVEHALEAFRALHHQNALFLLKGGYSRQIQGLPQFKEKFKSILDKVYSEPWFLWDDTWSSQEEAMALYRHFDLYLHPSGIDYASNTVVEILSMGVPCLVLHEETNPYLFNGAAAFFKREEQWQPWQDSFYAVPDQDSLKEMLYVYLSSREKREQLGRDGRVLANRRFGGDALANRLPLLFRATEQAHCGQVQPALKQQLKDLFLSDMEDYAPEKDFN